MARYFLFLSYDGTELNGWQIQKNTAHTVQHILEEKLGMILKQKIEITGCGRTDTGVSAKNYVAHFDLNSADIETEFTNNKKHWIYKFNQILPVQIAIQNLRKVNPDAHARFDAKRRTYNYFLTQTKNPFETKYSWYVHGELDFELMNKAALELLTQSDFSSFSKAHTQNKTNNCKIYSASWQKMKSGKWKFTITSNRFLRGMVRAVVGTLILVGQNKISVSDFNNIIKLKSRKHAGPHAPAQALFLTLIKYPKSIFID